MLKRDPSKRPGQVERQWKYRRELKALDIQKPRGAASARHVKIMKELKDALRHSWAMLRDNIDDFQRFSEKQIAFARHYAKNGRTNKTAAARAAGYLMPDPTALLNTANHNLKMPYMDQLITAFEFEEKARMKICVEDVVAWFNRIAEQSIETGDFTNANRAMENLAKYLQMFVEKKEVTHRVIHSREELDARIVELTKVLKDAEPEIERNLGIRG